MLALLFFNTAEVRRTNIGLISSTGTNYVVSLPKLGFAE
jgi:hypothetical protein